MEYFRINGLTKLSGDAYIHGAKNSVLPILAASILIKGESVIHNCPQLSDVDNTVKILEHLGARVKREGKTLIVDSSSVNKYDIPQRLMQEMRSSIIFLGALLSRMKTARLYLPGGCKIGLRPIDLHLKGLSELGYGIESDGSSLFCSYSNKGAEAVVLSFPSVGATENLILASVFNEGKTRIINSAREPEIEDLCEFLNGAGAKIKGAGSTIIEIEGVASLHSTEHTVIPDRILASTIMCAAAITGGSVRLNNIRLSHLAPVLSVFNEAGCKLYAGDSSLVIKAPKRIRRVKKIETRPYPGFPTDSQAMCSAMLTLSNGVSMIYETIFENRFRHMPELMRFGADITVQDRVSVINGVKRLKPASACCTDLRGGAAVVIAALSAQGESEIRDIHHIDRGYENFERQLNSLGAAVKRISDEKEKEGNPKQQQTESERRGQSA